MLKQLAGFRNAEFGACGLAGSEGPSPSPLRYGKLVSVFLFCRNWVVDIHFVFLY